jgi:pimeloyl-ACP methyl ester carboxylesterase
VARSEQGCSLFYTNPTNFTDEAIEFYYSPLLSTPLRRTQFNEYAAAFLPNPLLAIEPALKRCTIPTRIVWGTNDFLFNVSWAEWLDRTLPHSRGIRFVEGAKLFFPEEMPELIAEEARGLWLGAAAGSR